MNYWFENYVMLDGPDEEINRFRAAIEAQDCKHGCRFICLHHFAELLPPIDPNGEIVYIDRFWMDDNPYNIEEHSFVVSSAWRSIGILLVAASAVFPAIKFHCWSCEDDGTPYSMDIQHGKISNEVT